MSSTLDLCEKYFETRDIYKLLNLKKNALEKDVKKAYYKLSLKVHPDRVPEAAKEIATEKFKILSKVYEVLTDKARRALYDEQGIIDEDDDGKLNSWLELWKKIFKPITTEDIDNYQKEYTGSELERTDIKKAYLNGKGCINYMFDAVPFIDVEDEPRLQEIVKQMIDAKEVPEYKIFTHEPADKRKRRHKKYAREQKEANEIKKKMSAKSEENLEQQLMKRQEARETNFNSLMDKLLEKYGNDEDESIAFETNSGKRANKKTNVKRQPSRKSKEHSVRNGRVSKGKK